jgi:tRNA (mo5U34)-methyltransferase
VRPVNSQVRSTEELRHRVAEREWYHTLELRPGLLTPGFFDTRSLPARMPFPQSMEGYRCLDVATFDGFWAFEMERRGASEVIGIDILDPLGWDWPAGSTDEVIAALERRKEGGVGFRMAAAELCSSVEHRECSVYELDPAVHGQFDFVYVGSLLMHLRDPVRALERVRSVCRGRLLLLDNIDLFLSAVFRNRPIARFDGIGRPWWWKPNTAALARMVRSAGFQLIEGPRLVFIPPGPELRAERPRPRWLLTREGRDDTLRRLKGDPHAWILARAV